MIHLSHVGNQCTHGPNFMLPQGKLKKQLFLNSNIKMNNQGLSYSLLSKLKALYLTSALFIVQLSDAFTQVKIFSISTVISKQIICTIYTPAFCMAFNRIQQNA